MRNLADAIAAKEGSVGVLMNKCPMRIAYSKQDPDTPKFDSFLDVQNNTSVST